MTHILPSWRFSMQSVQRLVEELDGVKYKRRVCSSMKLCKAREYVNTKSTTDDSQGQQSHQNEGRGGYQH